MKRTELILIAGLAAFAAPAFAGDVNLGDLTISTAWTRATPGAAKTGGGYLTIKNSGSSPERLIGVAAKIAARSEIHETKITDGVMSMAPLTDGLVIQSGQTVELKPGSIHLMFMGLTAPLKQGDAIPVTLSFEKAGAVEITLDVMKIGAKKPEKDHSTMDHSGHGSMEKAKDQ